MKMSLYLLAILLFWVLACKTEIQNNQILDFGVFKLTTPAGWKIVKKQGIDSYYGGLTNGKDSLWFDYGWYSSELDDETTFKHHFAEDTVNGLEAMVMKPDTNGKGYISMHIPIVKGRDKFTIWGENIKETEVILKIYKSIVFENSDTTSNPSLTASKFIYSERGSGKTLFSNNCASCHAINKILSGPALYDLMQKRNSDWLFTFLTDRKHVVKDSLYYSMLKAYDFKCTEFEMFTKKEVELISEYIKNYNNQGY